MNRASGVLHALSRQATVRQRLCCAWSTMGIAYAWSDWLDTLTVAEALHRQTVGRSHLQADVALTVHIKWKLSLICCVAVGPKVRHLRGSLLMSAAGDHIWQSMLQVGSASEPVAYVEGILGEGHLHPVGCGYKPQIHSLLMELRVA